MAQPTFVKDLKDLIRHGELPAPWRGRAIVQDDNLSYLVWNEKTREALVVDPVREDWDTLVEQTRSLGEMRFIAVIDTHTHADHVSAAGRLAGHLRAPLIMHARAPSTRVDIRISRDTALSTSAGRIEFIHSPGHTPDCMCVLWGPFLFVGDVLMFADSGRNDLPGGDPVAHYDSLARLKARIARETLMLPGHDDQGGRVSSWAHQLESNPSLKQARDAFITEASAYNGPAPRHLKESLFENTK